MALQTQNSRNITDYDLTVNVTLPNAANVKNTAGIGLGAVTPFPLTEQFQVRIDTTQSTGANSKNINVVIQDSADNITFANIALCGTKVIAGNAANFPAATATFQLPPTTRRYIRASATGEANGGDASDGTLTATLVF